MAKCKTCLLPEEVPGANFNNHGICEPCRLYADDNNTDTEQSEQQRQAFEANLEETIKHCRNQAEYDCIVCLSGGKDSLHLLYKLKVEYGLKILAFTTDINIPPVAWNSMKLAIKQLGVDHLVYKPNSDFFAKLFRHILQNQEARGAVYSVSYVYAPLFEGDAIRLATEKGIPVVFAGYSPGQPEPERMLYEFSRELICDTDWTPPALKDSGILNEQDLARFWNPTQINNIEFPRYIAPFHAWPYNQEDIMNQVKQNGLVARQSHANPINSNFPINWLLMYSDIKNLGYNPYNPEFSTLIREGKANLNYWRVVQPLVNFIIKNKLLIARNVTKSLDWLDLSEEDLKITLPKGAYDPPVH